MSISDQITRLNNAKAAIKQAISNKGVEVSDEAKLDEYPALIDSIEVGGGADEFFNLRTDNGTNFSSLFYSYTGSELDLSNWDTSNVADMNNMFAYCNGLTSLDLSNWDTSNVFDMNNMFAYCFQLKSLNLSHFNTSNVANMNSMFPWCNSLEELDIRNFNVDNIEYVDYMFEGCSMLHKLRLDNCGYDTINKIITSIGFPTNTIDGTTRKIYVKEANIGDLTAPENWEFEIIDKVEDLFADYSLVFKADDARLASEHPDDISHFSIVTADENMMFLTLDDFEQIDDCYALKTESPIVILCTLAVDEDLNFDMTSINSMTELVKFDIEPTIIQFVNCLYLTSIDLSHIDGSSLDTTQLMFMQCVLLEEVDIRNFDVSHIDQPFDDMFAACISLHTLRLDNCNNATINKIITSKNFPTGSIEGVERKIYCKEENAAGLTPPKNWVFEYVD